MVSLLDAPGAELLSVKAEGKQKFRQGLIRQSLELFEKALEAAGSGNTSIRVTYAKILIELELFSQAERVLQAIEVRHGPQSSESENIAFWKVKIVKAKLYFRSTQHQRALETLQELATFAGSLDVSHPLN